MKEKIFLIFLILILAAACTPTTSKKSAGVELNVGLSGLTLEFFKNTPPVKVFEGDIVPVVIKVRNKGAYNIKEEKAVISLAAEKDYTKSVTLLKGGRVEQFENLNNAASFILDGKSKINPNGEEEVISYNVAAGKIDPQSEIHQSTVIATLCYPYETVLSSNVCIDTDINNLRPAKKVCQLQDLTFNNGQGAPVAITKVEINMLPSQIEGEIEANPKIFPQFLIYVEDKGQGTVIRQESVKQFCTKSDTSHSELNIVYVDATLSGKQLKCQIIAEPGTKKLGHIKLKDKKDIIRCTVNPEDFISTSQDAYVSPLKIVLAYGYSQSISASYIIQKTAR